MRVNYLKQDKENLNYSNYALINRNNMDDAIYDLQGAEVLRSLLVLLFYSFIERILFSSIFSLHSSIIK